VNRIEIRKNWRERAWEEGRRKIKVKHTSTKASKRKVGFLNSPAGAVGRK
jgi:hypothetical protein